MGARTWGFGMIGCGLVAPAHARALARIPGARLVAVASRRAEPGRRFAAEWGAQWHGDWRELVARPDVDVVSLCTPPAAHLEQAEAAARAGKHVLCEKPLEITLARADRLIAACGAAGVRLQVVLQHRRKKAYRALKRLVERGGLGRLIHGEASVKWHRPQSYYDSPGRGRLAVEGGGALINQAIHTLDILRWIMGECAWLCARTATAARRLEGEDLGVAALAFRNGALGVVQGATAFWPGLPERLEVRGTRGTVVVEGGKIALWEIEGAGPEDGPGDVAEEQGSGASDPMAFPVHWHEQVIRDLLEAIAAGRDPESDGAQGRQSLELVRGIYRSARTGAPVEFPLAEE